MASGSGDEERGTSRLLLKLKEAIDTGRFYEAHQFMRTINFRYRSTNKVPELEELLIKTAITLLDTEQFESGSDVANMLAKLYLEDKISVQEDRIQTVTILVGKMTNSPERAMFIANIMEWTGNQLDIAGSFNSMVAQIYITQEMYQESWKHVIRMTDASLISKFVFEIISKSSIPNDEIDLVIAILVLTLISGKRIPIAESVFSELKTSNRSITITPLMNALAFTIEASKVCNVAMYKSIKQTYWPSLNREPNVTRLFNSVGKAIFKIPGPNQNSQRNGFMENLFSALAQSDSPQGHQASSSSNSDTLPLD